MPGRPARFTVSFPSRLGKRGVVLQQVGGSGHLDYFVYRLLFAGADIRLRVEGLAGLVRDLTAIAPEALRTAA